MSELMEGRSVHIDQLLTNMAINYRPGFFIADLVFPIVTVRKQSDLYLIHDQGDLFRREDALRSRGTEAKKISSRTSSETYFATNYALKADITLEDRANADPIFLAEIEGGRSRRVLDKLMLDMEVRVASLAFNTSEVGSSAAVGSAWTDHANSNPLEDIWAAIDNVQSATGYRPTDILYGHLSWRHFQRNTTVANRATNPPGGPNVSGGGLLPSTQQIGDMLNLNVLVGNTYYNTAEEGIADALSPVWGDSTLVYFRPPAPTTEDPSFGYSFRWSAPGLPNMGVERLPYDAKKKVDELEIGYYQDEKVTAKPLAFLITNVTSST